MFIKTFAVVRRYGFSRVNFNQCGIGVKVALLLGNTSLMLYHDLYFEDSKLLRKILLQLPTKSRKNLSLNFTKEILRKSQVEPDTVATTDWLLKLYWELYLATKVFNHWPIGEHIKLSFNYISPFTKTISMFNVHSTIYSFCSYHWCLV